MVPAVPEPDADDEGDDPVELHAATTSRSASHTAASLWTCGFVFLESIGHAFFTAAPFDIASATLGP